MNVCYLSTDHTKQQGSKWKPQSGWHNYSDRWGQHWGHDPSGGPKQDKGSHLQTQPHHAEVNLNTTRTRWCFLYFWLLFTYFISSKLNSFLVFPSVSHCVRCWMSFHRGHQQCISFTLAADKSGKQTMLSVIKKLHEWYKQSQLSWHRSRVTVRIQYTNRRIE